MKKIEINDREVFERYHVNSIINSEYQFSTLFIWQHAYNFEYEVWNDCLIVYGTQRNGDTQVYFPIGKVDDLDSYVGHIKHIFGDLNQNVNIRPLSESMKERLLHFIDFDIEVGSKESYSDYIYDYIPLKNYSGSIKLGNMELSKISENALMDIVTYIPHNGYIFKGTIEYNLKMGKSNATKNEMLNVLQKVNLLDFVNSENGLKTKVTEQGNNLSGGQRQRLAIARALLHNTPIYIFDESTSNIDLESEEDIMTVIYELAKEKTVIMISHRLANAINSNNIFVINNGTVVENGTHTKLIEQSGYYAELFNKQQNLENFNKGGVNNE